MRLQKPEVREGPLGAVPAGSEGSYPLQFAFSILWTLNPVNGTRSPQPVENHLAFYEGTFFPVD
jgi:hypothetical protein